MLIHVPLDQIEDNPYQRRQDYGDVTGLAADIQRRGLLQIPRGRLLFDGQPQPQMQTNRVLEANGPGWPAGASFRVQLAFGHRRLRAYRALADAHGGHWTAMPVYIEALTDDAMLDAVWSENQHRSDINPIEQAELLAEKLDRVRADGGNQTTVANEWGLDRSTIANKLRLLDLPADVQTAVRERKLSERQALALLSVAALAQRLNSSTVEWGDTGAPSWQPRSPAGYIAAVVADPDKTNSDAIRQYVDSAARHAGKKLPERVATTPVDGDVVQPLCKGCPHRFDQYCLYRPCLENKQHAIAESIARTAADEVGLPYSGDPGHFTPFAPGEKAHELHELYDAGITDNIVIGYDLGHGGAGLFRNGWQTDPWLNDGRYVVVLGHRLGKVTDAERRRLAQVAAATTNGRPPDALLRQWNKNARRVRDTHDLRGRAAVREALEDHADARVIRILYALFATDGERNRKQITSVHDLQKPLWEMARARPHSPDAWCAFLATAGLDPLAAEPRDEAQRLRELVTVAADEYFQYDSDWRREKYAHLVVAACNALDAYPHSPPDDIQDMAAWLQRARPEAERILAAKPTPTADGLDELAQLDDSNGMDEEE